ncbi:MAG: adenylyl-sulfate kinase [Candidatus Zambryskibacteria bacterium]|nr:adenylyl-sulfate kinase [Candidatus Zambryskibacteria bacterium]
MSKSLFIGRWQPFHDGHKSLIQVVLDEGGKVVIAVRDTPFSEGNPYTVEERMARIRKVYGDNENVEIIAIPDIKEVCYGRDVGWGVRRIRLEKQIEEISATKIRNSKKGIIWLTGNVGAGKTSIAYLLKEKMNAIVLDGDELRASISTDLGFSRKDRDEHNMRVARLAKILNGQGFNVVVSVIAPFQSTRDNITELINPFWIYIKGGKVGEDMPYEVPKNPDLTIDPSEESLLASLETIIKKVGDLPDIT